MKVLLVNSNTKADVLAAPPIGLCYVAEAAQRAGHDVRVVDLCFRRDPLSETGRAIRLFSPDIVGVSIRNIDNTNMLYPRPLLPAVGEVVRQIRSLTTVPLVLGGSGAGLMPEAVLRRLGADYIVVSDGEQAFTDLLAALSSSRPTSDIPGVGTIRDGTFTLTPARLVDFTSGSARLGNWIDLAPYRKMGASYTIQTKRGCRHRCIYCTYNQLLEGNRLRLRSPGDVADEIQEAHEQYGARSFEFVDSVFNDPLDHCATLLEEIARRNMKVRLYAMGVSPRGLDRGFLDIMWRAGFRSLWITPESASETMLHNYGKGFTLDEVVAGAETLRGTRFSVVWDFLIGGPGETNDTLQETLDFTLRYLRSDKRPPFVTATFFVGVRIYPRTRLWEIALEDGFITEANDPLEQLWYLSHDLDLEAAMRQMVATGLKCPEMISGFDEMYLGLSRVATFLGRAFGIPDLYWRLLYRANKLLRKYVLRFSFKPAELVGPLVAQLARQGCRHGRHKRLQRN